MRRRRGLSSVGVNWAHSSNAGLQAWWVAQAGQSFGDRFVDLVGDWPATVYASPGQSDGPGGFGLVDYAWSSNQYCDVPNMSAVIASQPSWAIESVAEIGSTTPWWHGLCGFRGTNAEFYMLHLNGGSTIEARFTNSAGSSTTVTGTGVVDQLAHYMFVYDGANVTLYINGRVGNTSVVSGTITATNVAFHFGRDGATGSAHYFNGRIASTAVFAGGPVDEGFVNTRYAQWTNNWADSLSFRRKPPGRSVAVVGGSGKPMYAYQQQ